MPQWGRPSGARIGRNNRELEKVEFGGDKQQLYIDLTGSDQDDDADNGEEYELHTASSDPTMAYALQLAMKDDDEWVLERALEKIRQARRQGRPAVNFSNREREVLERSRLQSERDQQRSIMAGSRRVSAPSSPPSHRRVSDAAFSSARQFQPMRSRTPSTQTAFNQSPQMHHPIPHSVDNDPPWLPPPMPPPDSFIPQSHFPPYMSAPFIPYDAHYPSPVHRAMPPPLDAAYHPMHFVPSSGSVHAQVATHPPTPQPTAVVPSRSDNSPDKSARPDSSGSSSSSDTGVRVNGTAIETTITAPAAKKKTSDDDQRQWCRSRKRWSADTQE